MKRFAIFMTLLSALFSGCGKEEADSITGYDRTMLFNSVAADCTSVGPFAFTAAWAAGPTMSLQIIRPFRI